MLRWWPGCRGCPLRACRSWYARTRSGPLAGVDGRPAQLEAEVVPLNVVGGIHEVFRVIAALGCAVCVVKSFRARERLERIEWLVSATLFAVLAS